MRLITILCLIVLYPQFTWADNPYLQQIKQKILQGEPDKKRHQRIQQFVQKKIYTIKHLPAFHQQQKRNNKAINLCQNCHSSLPHSKNTATRTFLNQHSLRIDCLTCHYQSNSIKLDYQWLKQNDLQYIAPYYQHQSLVILAQDEFAQQIKRQWKNANIDQKARIHLRLHQPLNINQTKIQCGDCHQSNGFLDLQALGFSTTEIQTIETNLVSRFVEKLQSANHKKKASILLRGLLQ
jgi:hypothetical protein